MSVLEIAVLVMALALLGYLIVAFMKPEWFA
jgi:K+-transporting ATPase KdpF subunit